MKIDDDEAKVLEVMARIGKHDRELYRLLRQEAWALVTRKHARHSPEERAAWLADAS